MYITFIFLSILIVIGTYLLSYSLVQLYYTKTYKAVTTKSEHLFSIHLAGGRAMSTY